MPNKLSLQMYKSYFFCQKNILKNEKKEIVLKISKN